MGLLCFNESSFIIEVKSPFGSNIKQPFLEIQYDNNGFIIVYVFPEPAPPIAISPLFKFLILYTIHPPFK